MRIFLILILLIFSDLTQVIGQTDVSLFLKSKKEVNLHEVASESGNLFHRLGHHGPAVENEWFALRLYFNKLTSVDVYSKANPGLELQQARWYPTKKQQKTGWGADYYKVGKSVGLGGIRLWNGEKVVPLNPVAGRMARVSREGANSCMEMLSSGIPYKGTRVDILVRITVFADSRMAKIEAFSQLDTPVQFVTGINYHKGVEVRQSKSWIATWGIHPEDVAAEKIPVGAALIINPDDYCAKMDDGSQVLLVSKPARNLVTWITSCNGREPEMNSFKKLIEFINQQ